MVLKDASITTEERLASAIELAGAGVLEWMACLIELHEAFGADSSVVYAPPHAGRSFVPFLLHRLDLSRVASRMRAYSTQTPFLDQAIALGLAPGAFFDRDVVPPDFIEGEHHREILKPMDWSDGLQFTLRLPGAPEGGLVIKHWRFHPSPQFGVRERKLAERLYPFLQRATKDAFLTPAAQESPSAPQALDTLSTAFMLLCKSGKALYLNAAAKRLLASGDVIASRNGKVEPVDQKALRRFQQAVDEVAQLDTGVVEIVLPRLDEGAPVLAVVASIGQDRRHGAFAAEAAAIAYFVDGEAPDGHALQARRAKVLFGLTDAESDVLRLLLDDLSVEEIAARRVTVVATVRTQIKAILQKTRSHRQQDLLRFRRLAI